MDGSFIIKEFLKENIFLTPEEFEKLTPENYREYLLKKKEFAKRDKPAHSHVEKTTENEIKVPEKTERETKEKKEHASQTPENNVLIEEKEHAAIELKNPILKPIDISYIHAQKYKEIKEIILEKTNPVSINKLKDVSGKAEIIGVVFEKTQRGFVLEDETGSIDVICGKEEADEDDVVGVRGAFRNGVFVAEEVIYPDVPLGRESDIINIPISVRGAELSIGNRDFKIDKPIKHFVVSEEKRNMRILFYKAEKPLSKDEAVKILKRRFIEIRRGVLSSFFVIKKEPDVFIISSEDSKEERINYKGVSIFLVGGCGKVELKPHL